MLMVHSWLDLRPQHQALVVTTGEEGFAMGLVIGKSTGGMVSVTCGTCGEGCDWEAGKEVVAGVWTGSTPQ